MGLPLWLYHYDGHGRCQIAAVFSATSTVGTLGSAAFPVLIPWIVQVTGSWDAAHRISPRVSYGTGVYQETIGLLAAGSLERLTAAVRDELMRLAAEPEL